MLNRFFPTFDLPKFLVLLIKCKQATQQQPKMLIRLLLWFAYNLKNG